MTRTRAPKPLPARVALSSVLNYVCPEHGALTSYAVTAMDQVTVHFDCGCEKVAEVKA